MEKTARFERVNSNATLRLISFTSASASVSLFTGSQDYGSDSQIDQNTKMEILDDQALALHGQSANCGFTVLIAHWAPRDDGKWPFWSPGEHKDI